MGEGIKLPEAERPSLESISKRLDDRIPRRVQNLFVQDIQNDCVCATETYDSYPDSLIVYTSPEGLKRCNSSRLPLPMQPEISEKDIWDLLEAACTNCDGSGSADLLYSKMIYNPASDIKRLFEVFEKHCYPVHMNRSGEIMGWLAATFTPVDCCYMIPEPEFFGAISVNINKFGVFCFANTILKVRL